MAEPEEPTLDHGIEIPEGRVLVRRVAGHGDAYLVQYGVIVREGEYWHMSPEEADARPDWHIVHRADRPDYEEPEPPRPRAARPEEKPAAAEKPAADEKPSQAEQAKQEAG